MAHNVDPVNDHEAFGGVFARKASSFLQDAHPGHRFAVLSSFSESVHDQQAPALVSPDGKDTSELRRRDSFLSTRPPLDITTRQFTAACLVFLCLGMSNFYTYSAVLNSSNAVQSYIFPEHMGMADSVPALFMTSDFLITILLTFTGSLNQYLVVLGLVMMALGTLSLAFVCHFVRGLPGVILYHILCFIVGSGSSVSCSASFTLANGLNCPTFPATVSTGGGFVGVVSFVLWILLRTFVVMDRYEGVISATWILFGAGAGLQLGCLGLYFLFVRQRWVREYLGYDVRGPQGTRSSLSVEAVVAGTVPLSEKPSATAASANVSFVPRDSSVASNSVTGLERKSSEWKLPPYNPVSNVTRSETLKTIPPSPTTFAQKRREWVRIVSACYPALLCAFLSLYTTYLLFPVVGPNHWEIASIRKEILTGVFQFGDFSGRYIPVFARWCPFVMPRIRNAFYIVAARLVFIATFFLTQRLYTTPVFQDMWFQVLQIFALGFTAGWMSTLAMIYAPRYLPENDVVGRSQANSFGVLGILAGVSCGQWTSNLLKLI